jgi:hypothetical protein
MAAEKQKYITKTVRFGSGELTMYSLDGTTWSTRKDELTAIVARHEAERQKLAQLNKVDDGAAKKDKAAAATPDAEPKEADEEELEKDDTLDMTEEDDEILPIVDEDDIEEPVKAIKGKKAGVAKKPGKALAPRAAKPPTMRARVAKKPAIGKPKKPQLPKRKVA